VEQNNPVVEKVDIHKVDSFALLFQHVDCFAQLFQKLIIITLPKK
jgi:hypothetical protein